ncbi:TatD family hydrolase [Psychrobacter sp. ASPA161_6]|uniref:TatD family hydrolase n=1 Tax=Psychrobacter sp. ASPA161_6 TaxID=3160962 RepID=UPI003F7F1835
MTALDSPYIAPHSSSVLPLIDTHTHFDAPIFDADRALQVEAAYEQGVRHLMLVGYLYEHFDRLYETKRLINEDFQSIPAQATIVQSSMIKVANQHNSSLDAHIALGLHPFYIKQHTEAHLGSMAKMLADERPLAMGEIGLDTFTDEMKQPNVLAKQEYFFKAQLDMAVTHQLPVMLHIRKAHAEALAILKAHDYNAHNLGGVAHSFSGGEQEAKAFVKLGFKLGITGQVTNPNAKKLRRAIQAAVDSYGLECLVIETDCPDMTPIMCQHSNNSQSALGQNSANEGDDTSAHNRNVPANLPWVLLSLSELLNVPSHRLAEQLWQNSCDALRTDWHYPILSKG